MPATMAHDDGVAAVSPNQRLARRLRGDGRAGSMRRLMLLGLTLTGAVVLADVLTGRHLTAALLPTAALVAAVCGSGALLVERRRSRGRRGPAAPATPVAVASRLQPGVPGDVEFVTTAYWGILERRPDPEGLRHHVEALESGQSREHLLLGMVESAEAAARNIYKPGLRRLIDDFWRLRAG
ncbi:MAG TPA: DUF4214 domain-containing protein, partial [Acidimicrobiales bacterium]|nr:DUF4214 domain-containing protein [Acidimicrobiales bacterium]